MSEGKQGPESGSEGVGAGVDPAAMALALGSASRSQADAFLTKQEALIDDQRHDLHEQLEQIRLARGEPLLKDETAKHFACAATVDLTPSERSELGGFRHV